jgi:MFS family permease
MEKKLTIITSICFITFFSNSAYSSIAPFYPSEALNKGVDSSSLGLVFSAYSFSMFLTSPFLGNIMNTYG